MTSTHADIPSVADRARAVAVGAPVVSAHFLGDSAVFVLSEEALLLVKGEEEQRVTAHGGAILDAASDGTRVATAGDDGKVVATDAAGTTQTLASDAKRRWIDRVALRPDGTLAWSAGKQAFVRSSNGAEHALDLPSTPGALAFAPKGFRLAIAHYNGVTLWFPNVAAKPESLEWKGSHLGAHFSPDGRFLITSMQEPMLHGWRLSDRKDMRMSGYGGRVRSIRWTADGKWLATSGSTQLVLWPFQSKDGPMGKSPQMFAPTGVQAETVACHPRQPIVAVGYADGLVLFVRIDDGAEILARKPGGAPVTALAWSRNGAMLAFGTDDGAAGTIDLR